MRLTFLALADDRALRQVLVHRHRRLARGVPRDEHAAARARGVLAEHEPAERRARARAHARGEPAHERGGRARGEVREDALAEEERRVRGGEERAGGGGGGCA